MRAISPNHHMRWPCGKEGSSSFCSFPSFHLSSRHHPTLVSELWGCSTALPPSGKRIGVGGGTDRSCRGYLALLCCSTQHSYIVGQWGLQPSTVLYLQNRWSEGLGTRKLLVPERPHTAQYLGLVLEAMQSSKVVRSWLTAAETVSELLILRPKFLSHTVLIAFYCFDKKKYHDQKQRGEVRIYLTSTTTSQSCIEGSQSRNSRQGTWRQELKQQPRRHAAYWLSPPGFLSLLS